MQLHTQIKVVQYLFITTMSSCESHFHGIPTQGLYTLNTNMNTNFSVIPIYLTARPHPMKGETTRFLDRHLIEYVIEDHYFSRNIHGERII